MKEYYEKYKGKFEILGVDCNDTEAKWKAAVEKHQLPWIHVYNPKGGDLLDKYGIQGFPTKIVVGPDGKIVKTIVGAFVWHGLPHVYVSSADIGKVP